MFETLDLKELEQSILKAFNKYGELVNPWESFNQIPKGKITIALKRLIKMELILKGKPYRLTKRGKRCLIEQLSKSE